MRSAAYLSVYFFFQAEDGIRDADVTGVQTCALPICFHRRRRRRGVRVGDLLEQPSVLSGGKGPYEGFSAGRRPVLDASDRRDGLVSIWKRPGQRFSKRQCGRNSLGLANG